MDAQHCFSDGTLPTDEFVRRVALTSVRNQSLKGRGKCRGKAEPADDRADVIAGQYEDISPCGDFVAGCCNRGDACHMQHSIPFAMAVRHEWLNPLDTGAKDNLVRQALDVVGEALIAKANLFPRVLSKHLSNEEPHIRPKIERGKPRWSRRLSATESKIHGSAEQAGTRLAKLCAAKQPASGTTPRYLLVFDLEGLPEITEFPVLAIDTVVQREVGRFQSFVRPTKCFEGRCLTPDSPAIPFSEVLHLFDYWLREAVGVPLSGVGTDVVLLSCGDYDCNMVHKQCGIAGIPVPAAFRQWVNIKRTYEEIYGGVFRGMKSMLAKIGQLDADGNLKNGFHHLGMHDVENIGRCVLHLLGEGHEVVLNGWRS